MGTMGILIPCDGSEPSPISVGDYKHIQELVGGCFDVVRYDMDDERFPDAGDPFTAIGYVHDEGLLIGLQPNVQASLMFDRHLVGDVVVVSGTSPKGEYDGENYDVPSWFADKVFDGSLREEAQNLDDVAHLSALAIRIAHEDGLLDDELYGALIRMMGDYTHEHDDLIASAIQLCITYAVGRMVGMPKVTRDDVERTFSGRILGANMDEVLSDEAIASFINQEGE